MDSNGVRGCVLAPPPVRLIACAPAPFTQTCGDGKYFRVIDAYGRAVPDPRG